MSIELEHAIGCNVEFKNVCHFGPGGKDYVKAVGGVVIIGDLLDPHEQTFLQGHDDFVTCVAVSHRGDLLATGQQGQNADVALWSLPGKRQLHCFQEQDHGIDCVCFSHDDRYLYSCGDVVDQRVFIYDTTSGLIIAWASLSPKPTIYAVGGGFVKDIKRRDTGEYLFAACGGKQICLAHLDVGRGALAFHPVNPSGKQVREFTCMVFAPDYEYLLAGTTSGDVAIILMKNRVVQSFIAVCSGGVTTMVMLPAAESRLVVGGGDGSVTVLAGPSPLEMREERQVRIDGKITSLSLCVEMGELLAVSDAGLSYRLRCQDLAMKLHNEVPSGALYDIAYLRAAGQSVPTPRTPRSGGPTTRTRAPEATGPDAAMTPETPRGSGPEAACTVPPTARDTPSEVGADIDWLLVGQTRASLIAGACLAIGLRFAGTSDPGAKALLIGRLRSFRDARRSETHPALMASLPSPGMDLDRSTLETCQSVTAVALGMVMAGTGDLDALRVLRSLRKRADLETSCGVHMATHMAIGFLFLGGGRYTFDQDPLSIAALFMAAFPRFPTSLTDNRCHLQAFRHLYVLAARHRCVEAVEVDTKQPVDVKVCLQTDRGLETATLPRLMLTGPAGGVQGMALRSERYWPVAIERASPCDSTAKGRWMRSLEASRRLYVKRRSGHLAQRLNHMGAQGAEEAWFPSFTAPEPQHLERLLQLPRAEASAARPQLSRVGGLLLTWLQRAEAAGGGPLEPGTLAVSPAEWAAALCSAPAPLLPPGACELDFMGIAGEEDGSLTERFASLFSPSCSAPGVEAKLLEHPAHVRFSHWLHECIIESKLATYPLYLLIYLQTQHAVEAREGSFPPVGSVTSTACSAVAVDQLNTVEYFYRTVSTHMGAKHRPLLTEEFLAARCAAMRGCFSEGGNLDDQFCTVLRSQQSRQDSRREQPPAAELSEMAGQALVALFARIHGLPGDLQLQDIFDGRQGRSLSVLPRLRRLLPHASVQGLRRLMAVLEVGAT